MRANGGTLAPIVLTTGGRWTAATARSVAELVRFGQQRSGWTTSAAVQWWRARMAVRLQDAVATALCMAASGSVQRFGAMGGRRAGGATVHDVAEFTADSSHLEE